MKYHIHLHSNPAITTGTMAAYPEPKPEFRNQDLPYPDSLDEEDLEHWQSSLLAYIKEPGFKVGDEIYIDWCKGKLVDIDYNGEPIISREDSDLLHTLDNYKQISHYQEGQQIDPEKFRFVREVKVKLSDKDKAARKRLWERLECGFGLSTTEFKKLKRLDKKLLNYKWKEVKEPEDLFLIEAHRVHSKTAIKDNPAYTKFRSECREGTTLLTPR